MAQVLGSLRELIWLATQPRFGAPFRQEDPLSLRPTRLRVLVGVILDGQLAVRLAYVIS